MVKLEKGQYLKLVKDVVTYNPNTLEPITIPEGSHGEVTYVGLCLFVDKTEPLSSVLAVKFKEGSVVLMGRDALEEFHVTFEVL